jgi:uncharacterized protein YceH (UPF0502 family)
MELTTPETRVLGCLLEKELATPNAYPLTLNALLNATNQSSNRDPVVAYDEAEVVDALSGLREKGAARVVLGSGHRAEKYRHTLEDVWGLDDQHRAVLAVLMLRGPQTVGELRQRTERLARFDALAEVEQVLRLLANREDPLARRLERGPGQKEARWVELFSGESAALEAAARTEGDMPEERPRSATESLREEVQALREEVAALRQQLEDLLH